MARGNRCILVWGPQERAQSLRLPAPETGWFVVTSLTGHLPPLPAEPEMQMELPDGTRELRRVRFSREMFGEVHAKLWWEDNRERIHAQYL